MTRPGLLVPAALCAGVPAAWAAATLLPAPLGAILAAAAITLLPGWGLLRSFDAAPNPTPATLGIAAALGLGAFPVAAFWWTRILPWDGTTVMLASVTPVVLGEALRRARTPGGGFPPLDLGRGGAVVFALLVAAATLLASAPFLEHGRRDAAGGLHWFYMGHDWFKHLQVFRALASGATIPPQNPFLLTEQTFRYYVGFYLAPAAVARHVGTGRLTGDAGILFAFALALPAVVALLTARLAAALGGSRAAVLWAVALAGVLGIGWDAIPALGQHVLLHRADGALLSPAAYFDRLPDVNWWASLLRQEHVLASFMWVPQHVAAMASALAAWLLLWNPAGAAASTRRILAGLLLAACLAESVYVGTCAFAFAAAALLHALAGRRDPLAAAWGADLAWSLAAALAFSLPVVLYYSAASGGYSGLSLGWPQPLNPQEGGIFTKLLGGVAGRLLDLPLYYGVEFGPHLLFGAAFLFSAAGRSSQRARALLATCSFGLAFVTFVAPHGYNNILSRGGTLLALLLAAPAGAAIAGAIDRGRRAGGLAARAPALLALAAAGISLLSALLLAAGMARFTHRHALDAATTEALAWIGTATPPQTRLLFTQDPAEFPHAIGYFADRPFLVSDDLHEKIFLADTTEALSVHRRIDAALASAERGEFARSALPDRPLLLLAGPAPAALPQALRIRELDPGARSPEGPAHDRLVFLPPESR